MENVNQIINVDFFIPYNKQFGNVDMNWDVLINMKINKYLNATLNTTLKYDNDVKTINDEGEKRGAKVQFKDISPFLLRYLMRNASTSSAFAAFRFSTSLSRALILLIISNHFYFQRANLLLSLNTATDYGGFF